MKWIMAVAGYNDTKVQGLLSEELIPPAINITINDELVDAMKCLNMLGKYLACYPLKLCILIDNLVIKNFNVLLSLSL